MNESPILGQLLGGLFGQAAQQNGTPASGGGLGAALGAAGLGGLLAGALRNRQQPAPTPGGAHPYANHTALLVMLLPLAMHWVQKSGGLNAVLDRFRQQGLGRQAQSWVQAGDNHPVDAPAVEKVVGGGELQQMAQRLGVPEQEVAQAFAEIMPQMVDKLTPQGQVPPQADQVLDQGRQALEQHLQAAQREAAPS